MARRRQGSVLVLAWRHRLRHCGFLTLRAGVVLVYQYYGSGSMVLRSTIKSWHNLIPGIDLISICFVILLQYGSHCFRCYASLDNRVRGKLYIPTTPCRTVTVFAHANMPHSALPRCSCQSILGDRSAPTNYLA
jgi:hypothetical protein